MVEVGDRKEKGVRIVSKCFPQWCYRVRPGWVEVVVSYEMCKRGDRE
jgi:hypothetical protein